ncbi:MAG: SDR family NAD(P)-dependent oxidoreductase [Brachybacterium tyrofermentans]
MSTIVIVGAGPQLGFAIGKAFAQNGDFDVALVARRESQLDAMTDEFRRAGIRAAGFAADVTDRPALERALAQVEDHFGPIDVLEYSPAPTVRDLQAHPLVSAADLTVETALPLLATNLFGAITAIGQVLPGMLERGRGTILGTSGAGSGPMVVPQVANANVANAALRNWLLALHDSVAEQGVHVAHVALGAQIGNGRPASAPESIAELYWSAHVRRDVAEIFHYDLPQEFEFELADKFKTR